MHLYTFSGTGNSLHAARALAARFPDAAVIPVLRALHAGEVKTRAEVVGVVFPIHALTLPWVVRAFLEQADFSSASYIFAVVTRECFAKVFDDMDKLLARGASTSTPASPLRCPRITSPFLRPSPGDPPPP
ncbi:MAG: hypothetical protein SVT56_02785 [Chloroflexota bacterium]|jgi:hypothetical protein|nr:hypothetical protein [Chloroflexota bacterium]